jgi:hypothetical protein
VAFNEALYARGTGAQGGQFVSKGGQKSSAIGYDGTRGSGYGSKGGDDNVKALQKALNKLGITDAQGKPLAVDGKFGPRTTAAVRGLQKKLGLPVDGKVTPALLKRIQGLKKTTTLTDAKPATKKAAAPAKKAAPRKAAPRKDGRAATVKPMKRVTPVSRSVGYSRGMTDLERHGTHNQKSHGNRLGKPTNVAGKTGLSKATAALADKPEQGPAVAPKRRELSAVQIQDILKGDREWYMGNSRRNEDHLRILKDAGIGDDQAREILSDLGANPDREWETTNIASALHHNAERETRDAAEADKLNRLKAATPAAFARLLGMDGQEALVKSKATRPVFEAMQASGWNLTSVTGHGGYTFSSPDGDRSINILTIRGVTVYDKRHNKISGVKALAYVKGSA